MKPLERYAYFLYRCPKCGCSSFQVAVESNGKTSLVCTSWNCDKWIQIPKSKKILRDVMT